jgi:hypothetical protein
VTDVEARHTYCARPETVGRETDFYRLEADGRPDTHAQAAAAGVFRRDNANDGVSRQDLTVQVSVPARQECPVQCSGHFDQTPQGAWRRRVADPLVALNTGYEGASLRSSALRAPAVRVEELRLSGRDACTRTGQRIAGVDRSR